MHELSLMLSLVEQVEDIAKQEQFSKVKQIHIARGEWSGVDEEALRFCFPEAARNTCLQQAELLIENRPLKINCLTCGMESVKQWGDQLNCFFCHSAKIQILQGKELQIIDLLVEDPS